MRFIGCVFLAILTLLLLAGMIILLFKCLVIFLIILILGLASIFYDEFNKEVKDE